MATELCCDAIGDGACQRIRVFTTFAEPLAPDEIAIPVNLNDSASTHSGIACVWARKRIETLANQATYDNNSDLPGQIKQVALEYGLMSAYTAFIAVDSSRKTTGDHGVTVAVPVPVPDGVRYDTTVQIK